MTENEAITILKNLAFLSGKNSYEECEKSIGLATQALTEIQAYRAIGTVEDIQEVMALCKSLQETVCKYMDIGTVEEFKALKEKSVAKKVLPKGTHKAIDNFCCPNCTSPLTNRHEQCELPYCEMCGQKLDWNE